MCSSRPPSLRWGWMSPTPALWLCLTPTGSVSLNCTSYVVELGGGKSRVSVCSSRPPGPARSGWGGGGVGVLCLFVPPGGPGWVGLERVEAVAATLDGFELARVDLELRREGDVLGAAQSGGRSSLRLLRVAHHGDIIADARELAQQIVEVDPQLREHPTLADAVRRRLDDEASEFLGKG